LDRQEPRPRLVAFCHPRVDAHHDRLPPFFANVQKRLTKSPKVYVRDTGVLHHLAGLRQCMKDLGLRRGFVVTTAREGRRLSPGVEVVPWDHIASGQVDLF
jgi:predicted AAA+ superfamily ATPase